MAAWLPQTRERTESRRGNDHAYTCVHMRTHAYTCVHSHKKIRKHRIRTSVNCSATRPHTHPPHALSLQGHIVHNSRCHSPVTCLRPSHPPITCLCPNHLHGVPIVCMLPQASSFCPSHLRHAVAACMPCPAPRRLRWMRQHQCQYRLNVNPSILVDFGRKQRQVANGRRGTCTQVCACCQIPSRCKSLYLQILNMYICLCSWL